MPGKLNAAYHRAFAAAETREQAKAVKKQRAALRAQQRAQAISSSVQLSGKRSLAESLDHKVTESAVSVAPKAAQVGEETQPEIQTKPRVCICHGDRPAEMHGLCRKTVDGLRFSRPQRLPSDVVGWRRERAQEVAWKVRPAKTKYELTQEKFADPDVAQHVANAIVKKGMSYEEGIKAALPETKAEELGPTINVAKQAPLVQAAIDESLKKRGLDSDSRAYFVERLWAWFDSRQPSEERKTLQAARILGEHFIKNAPPSNELAVLRIEGIDDGLKEMFGSDYDKLKNLKPVSTEIAVEEFEEDDSEIGQD